MNPALFNTEKLTQTACYKSKALAYYKELAVDLVREYENHVQLRELADIEECEYTVGPYQPSGMIKKPFKQGGHPQYDVKSFNADESEFAKALDAQDFVWVRNKERLDYAIPLPVKSGSSSHFYPDFLWWVKRTKKALTIWAIDTTGRFILDEKIRTKLLTVPPPLRIALVVRGKLDSAFRDVGKEGWTLLRFRLGNATPEAFDDLQDLLSTLIAES